MMELTVDPRARGLIFDLDGTLVDSMPLHYEAWREVCTKIGFDFTENFFYAHAGMSSDRIFREIRELMNGDFDPDKLSDEKERIYESKIPKLTMIEPVFKIVKDNFSKLPMSIGTGSPSGHSWKAMKAMGLDRYFTIVVGKEEISKPKPAPDTFLKCAEKMNVEPQYCQVFEDGDFGLQAAMAAGMIATDIRLYINS
ncbi:MAG TPA: beta-phosphoglucomutase family hydrolase [Cyclobacteriaceae bacterium]|nr:beta-phosphoglucomutase family hydrolase [Cyclobacteriaceae bacterium]